MRDPERMSVYLKRSGPAEKNFNDKALESTLTVAGKWPIHMVVWHEPKRNIASSIV